jgi:uncharacterized protein DUF2752
MGAPLEAMAGTGHQPPATPAYVVPEPGRVTRLLIGLYHASPRWAAPAAILACFAGVAGFVVWLNPTDNGADTLPTCLVKATTGFDCPGCGGTRAFYYLLHGNLPEAARHHAMAVFAAPFLVWMYLAWAVKLIWGKQLPQPRLTARTISGFLGAWAVFTVVRNLPWAPFTRLYV